MQFEYIKDLEYVKTLLDANDETLANLLGASRLTLNRWRNGISEPSILNLENFYNVIYKNGIRLNRLKEKKSFINPIKESITLFFFMAQKKN